MFDALFPSHWSDIQKLMWLKILNGGLATWDTITGNPVSFQAVAAKLRQLKIAFSPVQDLHGYDSPWPAGGGVNKLPKCVAGTYTSGSCTVVVADDGTMTLSGTSGDTSTNINIPLVEAVYTPTEDFYLHFLNSNAMGSASLAVENSASQSATSIYGTLTPVNRISSKYTGGNLGAYVNRIRIWIAANTTISGTVHPMICLDNTARAYSPYSNICPISGWDSLTVEQRGGNLGDLTDLEFDDTTYSHSLNVVNYPKLRAFVNDIASLAGQTVYYSVETTGTSQSGQQKIGAFRFLYGGTNVQAFSPNEAHTIIPFDPSTVTSIVIYGNSNGASAKNFMISLGSSAPSTYQPYNPSSRSISISLGQTVYSGWVDAVTGVLTVTHGYYDMGSLAGNLTYQSQYSRFYWGYAPYKKGGSVLCEMFPSGQSGAYLATNTGWLYISTSAYTDKDTFLTAITGKHIVIELAEPLVFQLTPQEVNSLAGDNVLFSDANGDLTVEYRSN